MEIKSPAFVHEQSIPIRYTCDGQDISPPLIFSHVPEDTKSLVLIVDDPDAPKGVFDHWIVWNLNPETRELEEGATVPMQGRNHFGDLRYRGPCPPPGKVHHYRFKLYAVDIKLDLPEGSSKKDVENAIREHTLSKSELVGTYGR